MWHTLCWLLLAIVCTAAAAAPTPAPQRLAPFHYINGQLIDLDTGVQLYRLVGLKPSTGYEVRVSFPASIPATTKLSIVAPPSLPPTAAGTAHTQGTAGPESAFQHSSRAAGRRLQDCEKLIFSTDAAGAVEGIAEPLLELRAYRRSVHRDGPKAGAPKLVYNIVLAELVLGLPKDSIPTVVTIVGVVLVAAVASFFWSNRFFPQLLNYLVTGGGSSCLSSSSKGQDTSASAAGKSSSRAATAAAAAAAATPAAAGAASRKAANRSHSSSKHS